MCGFKNILCIMFLYFPKFILIFAAFLCRRKFMHVYIQECGCHIICVFKHVDMLRLSLCVYMNACVCVWMFLLLCPDVITIRRLTHAHTHSHSRHKHTHSRHKHTYGPCVLIYICLWVCVCLCLYMIVCAFVYKYMCEFVRFLIKRASYYL